LVGRLEGKRPLGRPRRRWEDNIKMDLREKVILIDIDTLALDNEVSYTQYAPATLSRGKNPRYPMERRLGGPQSRY